MDTKPRLATGAQLNRGLNCGHGGMRWNVLARYALLGSVACIASGCANDVVVQNPRNGATEICRQSLHGLDPWSQTMSCVAGYVAQGWTRSDQE